jgi:DNA-binding LacI/PurR family transcriptional regulator
MTMQCLRPMASIYDVAAAAGVSITTVSHVYSGNRHVAADTVARVMEAVKDLNYSPRLSAKALATGRNMVLGVCFPAEGDLMHRNPYFPALLQGLSVAASKTGYGFLLIPNSLEDVESQHSLLGKLDGVIVADPAEGDPRLLAFLERDLPIITIGRWIGRDTIPWVDNDHLTGVTDLFEHLGSQGYRHPLLLSKEPFISYEADLEQAFRRETAQRDMACRVVWCDNFFSQKTYDIAREILSGADRPDVIVASTDSLALSVLQAANDLGISIPKDLGVVGEGETLLSASSIPPLTTIRVFPDRLGDLAVDLLIGVMNGTATGHQLRVPVELVVRTSTDRRACRGAA